MYSIDFFEAWNILNKLNEDADYGTIQLGILYTDIIEEYDKLQNEKTDENSINFWCNVIDTIKRIPNGSGTYLDAGIDRSISYMVNAHLAEHALIGKQIILNDQGFNNKVFTLEWYTSNDATKERLIGKRGDNTPDFRCTESRLTFDVKNKETAEVCKDMTFNKYIKNGNAHGANILLFVAEDDKSVWFCNKNYPNNTATQVKSSIDNNFKIEPAHSFLDRTSTIVEDFISQSIKYPKIELVNEFQLDSYTDKFKATIDEVNLLVSEEATFKKIEDIEALTDYNNRLEEEKNKLIQNQPDILSKINESAEDINTKYISFIKLVWNKFKRYCLEISNTEVLNNVLNKETLMSITRTILDWLKNEKPVCTLSDKIRDFTIFNPNSTSRNPDSKISSADEARKNKYKYELNLILIEFLKLASIVDKAKLLKDTELEKLNLIQKIIYGDHPETKQGGYIFEITKIQRRLNDKITKINKLIRFNNRNNIEN